MSSMAGSELRSGHFSSLKAAFVDSPEYLRQFTIHPPPATGCRQQFVGGVRARTPMLLITDGSILRSFEYALTLTKVGGM